MNKSFDPVYTVIFPEWDQGKSGGAIPSIPGDLSETYYNKELDRYCAYLDDEEEEGWYQYDDYGYWQYIGPTWNIEPGYEPV